MPITAWRLGAWVLAGLIEGHHTMRSRRLSAEPMEEDPSRAECKQLNTRAKVGKSESKYHTTNDLQSMTGASQTIRFVLKNAFVSSTCH
jgi:hypothetical protein